MALNLLTTFLKEVNLHKAPAKTQTLASFPNIARILQTTKTQILAKEITIVPQHNKARNLTNNHTTHTTPAQSETTPQNTHERIKHDMDFLNKSRANLANMEKDNDIDVTLEQQHRAIDQQIAQEIQHNTNDLGFKVVTSKSNQKKLKKKKNNEISSTYVTRSKVVNPLSFK